MIFFELFIYLALDPILQIAPCKDARHLLRHAREDLGQLCLRRRGREQRILLKDAHECKDALTAILRSHECHCIHLTRLDDQALCPHRIGEHAKDRRDLLVDLCVP